MTQAPGKTAVFTFGRFQPPHSGHALLIDSVINKAYEVGGDAFIFTSKKDNDFTNKENWTKYLNTKSEKVKKSSSENPLKIADKVNILEFYHGSKPVKIIDAKTYINKGISNAFKARTWLEEQGYTNIIFIIGADRLKSFKQSMNKLGVEVERAGDPTRSKDLVSGTRIRNNALNISKDEAEKFINLYQDIDGNADCLERNKQILNIIDLIRRGVDPRQEIATSAAAGVTDKSSGGRRRKTTRKRKRRRKTIRKRRKRRKKHRKHKKMHKTRRR